MREVVQAHQRLNFVSSREEPSNVRYGCTLLPYAPAKSWIVRTTHEILSELGVDDSADLRISFRYTPSVGEVLFRPKQLSAGVSTCVCARARYQHYLGKSDHVNTCNPRFIDNIHLRREVARGFAHRPVTLCNRHLLRNSVQDLVWQLLPYKDRTPSKSASLTDLLDKIVWPDYLRDECRSEGVSSSLALHAVLKEIAYLQTHFFISGVDKSANTICFRCLRHEQEQTHLRLT